jgi:hypothetical protein
MRDAKRQLCMLISAQRNPTKKRNALIRQWAIEWRSSGFFVNAEELHYEAGPIRRSTFSAQCAAPAAAEIESSRRPNRRDE